MGRPEDNISSGKTTHPTMHVPVPQLGSLTPPAGHPQRQNISPLLVSDQLRRDIVPRSRENVSLGPPPRYHVQRDILMRSGAVGGLSAHHSAGVDLTAQLPAGILNRVFLVEDSMQPLQDTAFQPPTMAVPSYTINATAQSYEGNVTLPSGVGARYSSLCVAFHQGSFFSLSISLSSTRSFTNDRYMLDAGSPAQISGEIPDGNPVPLRRDTASRFFHGISSYGSNIIAPRYEDGIMRTSESTAESFGGRGAQQSASLQVFYIDGLLIDLPDKETNDDIITVGKCLRTDSPCGLWVKAEKASIKRHAQKWHRITRGGDTSIVPCTWAGCHATMQKAAVARHTLRKHFHETFQCIGCLGYFTRGDCWRSHAAKLCL
ncbi:hypothetical protein BDR07DRAFT_424692 [Suillus spraguei]|nr:hypothetical protein BDR07DRAFT_424692 [Suillus spraguei]